jgi:CheY-like chemotaxis protein
VPFEFLECAVLKSVDHDGAGGLRQDSELALTSPPMSVAPCPHFTSTHSTPSFAIAYSCTPRLVSSMFACTTIALDDENPIGRHPIQIVPPCGGVRTRNVLYWPKELIALHSQEEHTEISRTENIVLLIVDDDPRFLQEAEQLLDEHKGVFFARDAEHAKQLMGSVGEGFSVLMIDLDLPGQDGFSLIREFRQQFPDLPVIAISGVFQRHVLESAKLVGAAEALQKPITPEWNQAIQRARTGTSHA